MSRLDYAAIQKRNEELDRMLVESEDGKSASGRVMSSQSAAIHRRNQELERKLAEEEKGKSSTERVMSSESIAIHRRNQELERKLEEEEKGKSSTGRVMSSESIAIHRRNQELERKLAEEEKGKSSTERVMSSESIAIHRRNQELERKLAGEEKGKSSTGRVMSSESIAIHERNQELERKLAEAEKGKSSTGRVMSSQSVAIHERNKELERKLAEAEKGKSSTGRVMSSQSVAIHQRNQELERKIAEAEKRKSASGRVMSSHSVAVDEKNQELERKFEGLLSRKDTLSDSRRDNVKSRVIQLKKLINVSQQLDLAFLVDATGSMQQFIDTVKEKAPTIAAGIKKAWPKLKLRVAFAPYRDYEETTQDENETCDFTDDFSGRDSVLGKALSILTAEGGDDQAEDVFSGLQRVASLSWKSKTRVLVHIGDAPCHGREFHELPNGIASDRCPEGDLGGRKISSLLESLRDGCQIICYLFLHVNDSTKKMLSVFKQECGDANWIQEGKLSNISKLSDIVINVSTASIAQSIRVGDSPSAVCKVVPLMVITALPVWSTIRQEKATQIKYKSPDSLEALFRALETNGRLEMEDMPDSTVQIANSPFSAEGSLRWPYHAIVGQPPSAPRHMVVKRFKVNLGEDVNQIHSKEAYFEQMEVQTVAAKMAEEFNKELEIHLIEDYKTVQFTLVSALRVGSKFYNMEKFLEGKWIRYSNNLNYVNTIDYQATLHAFSHWTYHRSKGLLAVTDLQGVEITGTNGSKEFWLCDPAVHCKDALRYQRTRTNWSTPGMEMFLKAHECNFICSSLRLKNEFR